MQRENSWGRFYWLFYSSKIYRNFFKLQNRERAEVLVDKVSSMPYFTYVSDSGVNRIVFENQQV